MTIDVSNVDNKTPHPCPVCGKHVEAKPHRPVYTCSRACGAILRTRPRHTPVEKKCFTCKKVKPVSEFGLDRKRPDGLNTYCKPCLVEYRRSNGYSEKNRERMLRHHYGITNSDRMAMMKAQKGRCLICEKKKLKLYVDHCHKTGAVRGLLCPSCNFGLGYFKDDIETMHKAIQYLENHDAGIEVECRITMKGKS